MIKATPKLFSISNNIMTMERYILHQSLTENESLIFDSCAVRPTPLSRAGSLFFGVQTNKLLAAVGDFFNVSFEITILAAPLSHLLDHIHRNVDRLGFSVDLGGQKMCGVFWSFSGTPAVRVAASTLNLDK